MKKYQLLSIIFLLIFSSGIVFAQGNGRMPIERLDIDSDDRISREEFLNASHRRGNPEDKFNRLDTDRDGYITREEMKNRQKGREESGRKQGMYGGW